MALGSLLDHVCVKTWYVTAVKGLNIKCLTADGQLGRVTAAWRWQERSVSIYSFTLCRSDIINKEIMGS